jgi:hypothetical protein
MINLFLVLMSILFADDCRTGEFSPEVCEQFNLQVVGDQCCGDSETWLEDRTVEYTLINTLQFPHDPVKTLALCQAYGVSSIAWSKSQNRFLCAGNSDGRWLPDQEKPQYTYKKKQSPAVDLTHMMAYCQERGIHSVAFISSLGRYGCSGDSDGPWFSDVTQHQYGLGVEESDILAAVKSCQSWGIEGAAFHSVDQTFTCWGNSKGAWQPNGTMNFDLLEDILSPDMAHQACQNLGYSYFAFNEVLGHYQCGF